MKTQCLWGRGSETVSKLDNEALRAMEGPEGRKKIAGGERILRTPGIGMTVSKNPEGVTDLSFAGALSKAS
jgi:hypothetical protein